MAVGQAEDVRRLLPLQAVDLEIHGLRERIRECAKVMAPHEEAVRQARERLAAAEEKIKTRKLDAARQELAVREVDDKIQKLTDQVRLVRKNDEFQALQKEINSHKADKAQAEDVVLEHWQEIEHYDRERKDVAAEVERHEVQRKARQAEVDALVAKLTEELKKLEDRRRGVRQGLPEVVLATYERVLANKPDGRALVALEYAAGTVRDDPGAFLCAGCSMNMTLQDAQRILNAKEPITCPGCARLLYAGPTE